MGADMASTPNAQMLPLFSEHILDLLDDKVPVSQYVRSNVLHLIRLLIKSLRDGGPSAGLVSSQLHAKALLHDRLLLHATRPGPQLLTQEAQSCDYRRHL